MPPDIFQEEFIDLASKLDAEKVAIFKTFLKLRPCQMKMVVDAAKRTKPGQIPEPAQLADCCPACEVYGTEEFPPDCPALKLLDQLLDDAA